MTNWMRVVFGRLLVILIPAWISFTGGIALGDLPEPQAMLEAYRGVLGRISGLTADAPLLDPGTAVSVVLRLDGEVLGRTVRVAQGDDADGALDQAFEGSWNDTQEALSDRLGTLGEGLMDRLTVEIEAGSEFSPLLGATYLAATSRLSPGIDGVAMERAGRWGVVMPGEACALGLTPERAARLCAARLDLPPLEWEELRSTTAARLYSFRTQRLVQNQPGDAPVFVYRCGPLVALETMDLAELRSLAALHAEHIVHRAWHGSEPFGLRGDFSATTGFGESPFADPRTQATAVYTLLRYASLDIVLPENRARILGLAKRVLEDLLVVHPAELDLFTDASSLAAFILAVSEYQAMSPGDEASFLPPDGHAALDAVRQLRMLCRDGEGWRRLNPGERIFIGHALASSARWHAEGEEVRSEANEIVRDVLLSTPIELYAGLSPWVGAAAVELAGEGAIGSAVALREFRSVAWRFQVGSGDIDAPAEMDLDGGFVFTRGGTHRPTWHSLRVGALLAIMFADIRLTSENEAPIELARLVRLCRFGAQLTAGTERETGAEARRSTGGVRLAPWDPTVSLDATALSLLTITEVLEGVQMRAEMKKTVSE